VGTFLISVPLAMMVSIGLAVVIRALAAVAGASEADSMVLAFFTTPFVWAILAHVLLIQQQRRRQWKILLVSVLPIVPVALTGVIG
jgi:peptidoglycan/LPS O-acetylase OafA/YrhL